MNSSRGWHHRLGAMFVGIVMLAAMFVGAGAAQAASSTTETFGYTGAPQSWTVPPHVYYATFHVAGAQGGFSFSGDTVPGAAGGTATAGVFVVPGTSVTIIVGGSGGSVTGGFGGGGSGTFTLFGGGGGGGGASDIRIGGTSLANRVLVAGGGGGAVSAGEGGVGGGLSGGDGSGEGGAGGNQDGSTGSGLQGQGSNGATFISATGGGGGGYWGGAGGIGGGGGGGSGFGPSGVVFETGVNLGAGNATVTYTPAHADLSVSVGATPNPVLSGKKLTYTVTVRNYGPNAAFQPVITDTLPQASRFVSVSRGGCTTPAVGQTGTIVCYLPTIANGATATLKVVVTIVAAHGSSVTNTAGTSSGSIDDQPANNSATVKTTVL